MMKNSTVVWVRNDFRLHDNPALLAALQEDNSPHLVFFGNDDPLGKVINVNNNLTQNPGY